MGCKTSRLSGSWEAVHPPLHNGHYCHCVYEPPSTRPQYDTRPASPSVYSGHTHGTPAHSRSNSNDMVEIETCHTIHPMTGEQRPLLGSRHYQNTDSSQSGATSKSVYSRITPSSFSSSRLFSRLNERPKVDQPTPHFVFQKEKPLPSYPTFDPPKQDEVRRKRTRRTSHPKGVTVASCGHERQKDSPCFACLREKPKPRRHRSRRNAQVMIPRSSFMGRKKRRGSRSSSSSTESPIPEEELPSWVTDRHSVFVPLTPATDALVQTQSTGQVHAEGERVASSGQKGTKERAPKAALEKNSLTKAKGTKKNAVVDPYAAGGYIVSPEAYYSTLPLPDLPVAKQDGERTLQTVERKQRKNPVWI